MKRKPVARMRRRIRLKLKFVLGIDLFRDHMHTGTHLARALRETADLIDDPKILALGEIGSIRDLNGITVGGWEVMRVAD